MGNDTKYLPSSCRLYQISRETGVSRSGRMDLISEIKLWCLVRRTLGVIAVLIEVPVMAVFVIVSTRIQVFWLVTLSSRVIDCWLVLRRTYRHRLQGSRSQWQRYVSWKCRESSLLL